MCSRSGQVGAKSPAFQSLSSLKLALQLEQVASQLDAVWFKARLLQASECVTALNFVFRRIREVLLLLKLHTRKDEEWIDSRLNSRHLCSVQMSSDVIVIYWRELCCVMWDHMSDWEMIIFRHSGIWSLLSLYHHIPTTESFTVLQLAGDQSRVCPTSLPRSAVIDSCCKKQNGWMNNLHSGAFFYDHKVSFILL